MSANLTAKVYYLENGATKEIRKFGIDGKTATKYEYLMGRIKTFFSRLKTDVQLFWKDADDDYILVSSDDELLEFLKTLPADAECIKLYIKGVKKDDPLADPGATEYVHPGIICDGCDKDIQGARYICIVCPNFDLCSTCDAKGIHSIDHDMLRIKKPKTSCPKSPHFRHSTSESFTASTNPHCSTSFTSFTPYESQSSPSSKDAGSKDKNCRSPPPGVVPPQTPSPLFGHVSAGFGIDPFTGSPLPSFWSQSGANSPANNAAAMAGEMAKNVAQNVAQNIGNNPQFYSQFLHPMWNGQQRSGDSSAQQSGATSGSSGHGEATSNGPTSMHEHIAKMAQSLAAKPEFISEIMKPFVATQTSQCQTEEAAPQKNAEKSSAPSEEVNCCVNGAKECGGYQEKMGEEQGKRSEEEEFERRLQEAICMMESMGFSNDNGWLKQLLISKDLDIGRVVDALRPPSL